MSSRGKIKNKQTENQDSKGFSPQDSSSKTLRQLPSDQKQVCPRSCPEHFTAVENKPDVSGDTSSLALVSYRHLTAFFKTCHPTPVGYADEHVCICGCAL
ncbi:unnamed protein product [Gadus morhua 'NCC']